MPVATKEPYHIRLYNLPQRVEGGIKVLSIDGNTTYWFDKLDGMYSNCRVGDTDETIQLSASTPLVELGNDEYQIEDEPKRSDEDVANA